MTTRNLKDGTVGNPTIDWPSVWREHSSWLRTVLLARLRDGHAVDEVFQEMALNVASKPHRWPDPNKLCPWLYRVAIRQVQLYRRKRQRGPARLCRSMQEGLEPLDADAVDPVAWLIDRESARHVRTALAELNDQNREILMLRHAQNWTYRKIAEHLGVSIDKVIYRLGRAREELKFMLVSQVYDWTQQTADE